MATSTSDIYVWTWLPGEQRPVVAGLLRLRADGLHFRYGDRYASVPGAESLHPDILPLESGRWFPPTQNLRMPGPIRDAAPDSWGRMVILQRRLGAAAEGDTDLLPEVDYLLESGSDRLGAIDFQLSPETFVPRSSTATLDELYTAAELVEAGKPLSPDLAVALVDSTAIGGARPKALLRDGGRHLLAKFSTSDDVIDIVGAEAASILLARRAGIEVPEARIVRSMGRKALVIDRFDRPGTGRRKVVSALTMLQLPETYLPIGSYVELLDHLRPRVRDADGLAGMLYRRIAFNIAIRNTDDHLRNHAAFVDGDHLTLTPAYDLSPSNQTGRDANQYLAYSRAGDRVSSLRRLLDAHADYSLARGTAAEIIDGVTSAIEDNWLEAADFAELTEVQRVQMWRRQFLNPGIEP